MTSAKQLQVLSKNLDKIITGSDQVFNYNGTDNDFNFSVVIFLTSLTVKFTLNCFRYFSNCSSHLSLNDTYSSTDILWFIYKIAHIPLLPLYKCPNLLHTPNKTNLVGTSICYKS